MDRQLRKQTSMLSYWTLRYFIILCIGLVLFAAASAWWTSKVTIGSRLQTLKLLAQDIADRMESSDGTIAAPSGLKKLIDKRSRDFNLGPDFCVIITDREGKLVFSSDPMTQDDVKRRLNETLDAALEPGFRAITAPIETGGSAAGQVTILQLTKSMTISPELKWIIGLMLVILTALGWLTIYLLSRKLARPIRHVASAAREISRGRYDVRLEANAKEKELNELIISFKEMAGRLKHLEHYRSFMLAGLTHELKTPVTSVKGLVHAVKEEVATKEEAAEFLDIALQETNRLERMVTDLLHYNEMAAGLVQISRERIEAASLLQEIAYQWSLHQSEGFTEPEILLPDHSVTLKGDPMRIQQIIVNLLNNSIQSCTPDRPPRIRIELNVLEGDCAEIRVADNGSGIPEQEQALVFEQFFRGEHKKRTVRGLGLGLAFSRLLAEAMGGGLELKESSPEGSIFALTLPTDKIPRIANDIGMTL